MKQERLLDILLGPVVSEKAVGLAEGSNVYVFKVVTSATKLEIKQAVQSLFGVSVESVRTVLSKGKVKRFRGRLGQRPASKKAYVRLAEGQVIEYGEAQVG